MRAFDPITSTFQIVIIASTMIFVLVMFLGFNSQITIEKPYFGEYQNTLTKLEQCQESKTPRCAPVKVKCGATGIVWVIAGIVVYLGGLAFIGWLKHKSDRREKELDEREAELNKKSKRKRA